MEKLERDNKVLAELDKKCKTVSSSNSSVTSTAASIISSSLPSSMHITTTSTTNVTNSSHVVASNGSLSFLNQSKPNALISGSGVGIGAGAGSSYSSSHHGLSRPPTSNALQPFDSQLDELKQAEDIVDSIEIPNRGRCKVFIARYNYDPYKQSPNENPELEVQLMTGDFILVFGQLDRDGFYSGELMDGRRGLVPSNFIEKLTGEDLFEFQASVLYGHNRDNESESGSFPSEFYDAVISETLGHTNFQHLLAPGNIIMI